MSSPEQRRAVLPPPARIHFGRFLLLMWVMAVSLIGAISAGWFLVRLAIAEADKQAIILDAEGRAAARAIEGSAPAGAEHPAPPGAVAKPVGAGPAPPAGGGSPTLAGAGQ